MSLLQRCNIVAQEGNVGDIILLVLGPPAGYGLTGAPGERPGGESCQRASCGQTFVHADRQSLAICLVAGFTFTLLQQNAELPHDTS